MTRSDAKGALAGRVGPYGSAVKRAHGYRPTDAELVKGVLSWALAAGLTLDTVVADPDRAVWATIAHEAEMEVDDGYENYL